MSFIFFPVIWIFYMGILNFAGIFPQSRKTRNKVKEDPCLIILRKIFRTLYNCNINHLYSKENNLIWINSSINIRLRITFSTQFLFFLVLVFCWVFHEAAEPIIILGYFGYSAFLQIIYKSPCMSEQRTRLSGEIEICRD